MTALERKQNTERLLESLGIAIPHELPPMEEEDAIKLRTSQEIAARILIMTYLNFVVSEPDFRQQVIDFLKEESLWEKASEVERALFEATQLSEDEEAIIRWRGEAIWMLLWTINEVDDMDLPENQVNPHEVFERLPPFMQNTADFINSAAIRPPPEILDQADLMFRLGWAMRRAEEAGTAEIALSQDVAFERFYAINWVTSMNHEWDGAHD